MKKHEIIQMLVDKEAKEQGYNIEERDAFMAGIDAILEHSVFTEGIERAIYPDPKHDTHWEREKVKYLREGFSRGYGLCKLNEYRKQLQEKYKNTAT